MDILSWLKLIFNLLYKVCVTYTEAIFVHIAYGPPRKSWNIVLHCICNSLRELLVLRAGDTIENYRNRADLFPVPPAFGMVSVKRTIPDWCRNRAHNIIRNKLVKDLGYYPGPDVQDSWRSCPPLTVEFSLPFPQMKPTNQSNTMIYVHGGGHMIGSVNAYRRLVSTLSKKGCVQGASVEIRLSPEHPFPCALEDSLAAYLFLTGQQGMGIPTANIVAGGDSSGGGLSLALLILLAEHTELGMPKGAVLFSPWVDLTCGSPSFQQSDFPDYIPGLDNFEKDTIPPGEETKMKLPQVMTRMLYLMSPAPVAKKILERGHCYAPEKLLKYPLISPIHEKRLDLLPPLFVVSGECDRLRDENIKFCRLVQKANMDHCPMRFNNKKSIQPVTLQVFEDMPHVFPVFEFLGNASKAMENCGNFIRQCLADPVELEQVVKAFPSGNYKFSDANYSVHSWKVDNSFNFTPADKDPEYEYLRNLAW